MKIVMIYDQIQSGLGTKDDQMVPLTGKKGPIGPAVMMEPYLAQTEGHVEACLCCGSGTFLADAGEVSRKLCAMVNKLKPDVVMCGPAFNYQDYAAMCAKVALDIHRSTDVKAFAAMSEENEEIIKAYKAQVVIVRTPKKGGPGLNNALKNMCDMAKALAQGDDISGFKDRFCF